MEQRSDNRKSAAMMISSMLIFGTIGVFRRHIAFSSAFLAFARGMLGGLFLLAFTGLKKKDGGQRTPFSHLAVFAFAGILMGINWILLFEAYTHTTVATATLCYYMEPTIVILLSPLIFKERLTGKKMLCAAAAIAGMVLVSGVIGESSGQSRNMQGIALGLMAAVFYAAVVIMNKMIRKADAFQRTRIQLLSAGIVMIPYLILTNGFVQKSVDRTSLLLLFVVGIVHTGIAYALYFGSVDGMKVQSIAILSYIDPVSALFFSALLLREPLSRQGIAGAVMIIGSAMISEIDFSGRPA